jgi:hypothetical protein
MLLQKWLWCGSSEKWPAPAAAAAAHVTARLQGLRMLLGWLGAGLRGGGAAGLLLLQQKAGWSMQSIGSTDNQAMVSFLCGMGRGGKGGSCFAEETILFVFAAQGGQKHSFVNTKTQSTAARLLHHPLLLRQPVRTANTRYTHHKPALLVSARSTPAYHCHLHKRNFAIDAASPAFTCNGSLLLLYAPTTCSGLFIQSHFATFYYNQHDNDEAAGSSQARALPACRGDTHQSNCRATPLLAGPDQGAGQAST